MRLELTEYSASFAAAIATALGADSDFIADEVQRGLIQPWIFIDHGKTIGHALTRTESDTLVVIAYEGENVQAFADIIVRICELRKLPFARFHTQRPGLNRLLSQFNPEPIEYVMRIKCYGWT